LEAIGRIYKHGHRQLRLSANVGAQKTRQHAVSATPPNPSRNVRLQGGRMTYIIQLRANHCVKAAG
jgi:hypothetical protein